MKKLKDDTPLVTPDTTKASPGVKVEPAASNKGPAGAFHMPGKIFTFHFRWTGVFRRYLVF